MKNPAEFLSAEEKQRVLNAITHAESISTGLVRVRIEYKSGKDPVAKARQAFLVLGLKTSDDRNCVLFYVSVADKHFAVFGDDGINSKAPEGFWDMVVRAVTDRFEDGEYGIGLAGGISLVGEKLGELFPAEKEAVAADMSFISIEEKKMRLIVLALLLLCANAHSYPVIEAGFVHDSAGLLNPADTDAISASISSSEEKSGIKFRLFIINSVSDYPEAPQDFEDFCSGLFPAVYSGGFSEMAGIMVVAVKDRKAKIEIGTPLESKYSKAADRIVREKMVPYFKNNDYSRGIFTGFSEFKALFDSKKKSGGMPLLFLIALILSAAGGAAAYLIFVKKAKINPPSGGAKEMPESFGGGAWGKWQ